MTTGVLIVGAGPAGLTAAVTLARYGIETLLVERRADLSALPRATAISTRSMELLRAWGLEGRIREGGVEVDWLQWHSQTLAAAEDGHATPTGLPSRAEAAIVSPTAPACVPQDHLEPVLLEHLRSLGGGRVELGCEVVGVSVTPDGVRATLRTDGLERVVRARYLVAADGAYSSVRRLLGIPMHGPDDLLDAVMVQFRAPLWKVLGDRRHGLYSVTHPEGEGVFLPAGNEDRWLYAVLGDRAAGLDRDGLARRIAAGAGVPDLRPRIERTGAFSFAAQLADRFRRHSAFLVGDAAHRATPRGGTGMNTAIHDGHDLGWKLAWVLQGWAGDDLLDSYERERRPVAEHNVRRSADVDGTAREAAHELHADLGGRVPHAWAGPGVSTVDLVGAGLTLFTGARGADRLRAVGGRAPVTLRILGDGAARAIGIRGDGGLLVRPDGASAGWLAPSADALAA